MKRVDVGTMMGGAGGRVPDVFEATHHFMRKRDERCNLGTNPPLTVFPVSLKHQASAGTCSRSLAWLKYKWEATIDLPPNIGWHAKNFGSPLHSSPVEICLPASAAEFHL